MKFRRSFALILVLTILAGLLAGCGSSTSAKSESYAVQAPAAAPNSYADYAVSEEYAADALNGSGSTESGASALPANRKFIITVNMDAETEDLDSLLAGLNEKISSLSGYIESQNIHNGSSYSSRRYRRASMTVRIPVGQLDAFTEEIASLSNVVSSSRSTEDVTLNYVDTQSRVTALETEQARLLDMMAKAETMSDLLDIEARLTEVRYQLEQYSSRLRVLDNQIDFATIHLDIEEVREYTPPVERTRWQRICDGFVTSVQDLCDGILDFFAWILIDIPYLLVFGLVIFLIVFACKKINKKHKANKMKKLAAQYQNMQAAQRPNQSENK